MNIGWKNARPSAVAHQASLLYLYSNLAYIISFFFFFLVYFLAISYGMLVLSSQPGIKLTLLALDGGVLATGPSGKSQADIMTF